MKKCCFAGHSEIYNEDSLFDTIKKKAEELIIQKGVNKIWVGNYGTFDHLAASDIRELKKKFSDITLTLIISYLTKELN